MQRAIVGFHLDEAGEGVVFDLVIPRPGKYTFVDHDIRNVLLGAAGVLEVQ